jgi:hypothetical protein
MATATSDFRPAHMRADLRARLDRGPIVLEAEPGAREHELVVDAWDGDVLALDVRHAGTAAGLLVDVARIVVTHLASNSDIRGDHIVVADRDRIPLSRAFGGRTEAALSSAAGSPDGEISIDDVLGALDGDVVLAVRHAHLLTEEWAGRTLWTLRGRAQEAGPRIALLTRPWYRDVLLAPDAAFYGFAESVFVPASVAEREWHELAVHRGWPAEDARWLQARTGGQIAALAEVLEVVKSHRVSVRDALELLVVARAGGLDVMFSAARAVHSLGPRLLVALALGRSPYPSVPGAKTARVATALKALRDAEMVFQPGPRRWRVADPFVAEALRSHFAAWI